jgi:GalNAc-alpha-(1->4)-GalNAc-alpha-(1->3)-diNAcBac-PP-undecaprenol alpha-1,4-N-acetyl-D-galactosaminyltransferase
LVFLGWSLLFASDPAVAVFVDYYRHRSGGARSTEAVVCVCELMVRSPLQLRLNCRELRHMRIMLAVSSMVAGGAERVAATLVNCWCAEDHKVALITVASSDLDFYALDQRVTRIALDLNRSSRSWRDFVVDNFKRVRKLRSAIRDFKPEVILSFLDTTNVRMLLASIGTGVPVIVEEHTDPTQSSLGRSVKFLRRLLYKRARAVVVLHPGIARWARSFVRSEAIYVIPNPISSQFRKNGRVNPARDGHRVIAIGRLETVKGFDMLLRAFAQSAQQHPGWTLKIIGDGSKREQLHALAAALQIGDRVSWERAVKEPEKELHRSDLFVLSSRYEGFPMVLLEAMACGLAVVSFDCPSGPREIIHDGEDGLLVPANEIGALAAAMSRLMSSEDERKRLGERAAHVVERFGVAKVADMWTTVFEQVLR